MGMLELSDTGLKDLLDTSSNNLHIGDSEVFSSSLLNMIFLIFHSMQILGLSQHCVKSVPNLLDLINFGNSHRKQALNQVNQNSS